MESGNEVHLEPETAVHPLNETVDNPEHLNKVVDAVDSPITEVNQSSENVETRKARNPVKIKVPTKGSSLKLNKSGKSSPNTGTFGRTPRPSLSQSLSFPIKTKSPTISTSATPRSNTASRRTFTGLKPIKTALLAKEDDGTSSTASPNTATPGGRRRSSTAGFSFRLDERAERRKEFYSKIDERVQAKELEKTKLQEKSKESQEKEIKKLRKSLTFKATPMPDFYKEPPPKPQLKKIPPTRPRSPKLGRSKSSLSKSSEPTDMAQTPRTVREQTMSPRFKPTNRDKPVNQPNRKPLTKTSEVKTKMSKAKVLKPEVKEEKATQAPEGEPEVDMVQESGLSSSSANQDTTPNHIVVGR